jgi:hypothetical protein
MGIKRRSMYNPKFKTARPKRWELGRKKLGVSTDAEIEANLLAEQTKLKAQEEALIKAATEEAEVKLKIESEARERREEAQARLKADQEKASKLTAPTPRTVKSKSKPKTKVTKNRKARAKKD